MTNAYFKYMLSLLIFGSNGIVASYILLSSTEIVLSRTLIGSLFLLAIFILRREKPRFEEIKRQWFYLLGSGVGIMSAVLYATMILSNKKVKRLTGLEITLVQLTTAFMVVSLYTLQTQQGMPSFSGVNILPILFLDVVNTGVGCYLYFSSIHELPAQSVAICSYVDPLSALIISAIILGERLSIVQIAGAILILGGAAFGELYPFKIKNKEEFA